MFEVSLHIGWDMPIAFKRKKTWAFHPWCGIDGIGGMERWTIGIRILGAFINFDLEWLSAE